MKSMYYILASIGLTLAASARANASELEHWTCGDGGRRATWTIAENRMFTSKGKGALQVATNSPSLTIAYDLHRSIENKPLSYVYVLDKVARKLITYDESIAVTFNGRFGQPFEPKITIDDCEVSI